MNDFWQFLTLVKNVPQSSKMFLEPPAVPAGFLRSVLWRPEYEKIYTRRHNWEWLHCDESQGIQWNIAWAFGTSLGLKRYFTYTPQLFSIQRQSKSLPLVQKAGVCVCSLLHLLVKFWWNSGENHWPSTGGESLNARERNWSNIENWFIKNYCQNN